MMARFFCRAARKWQQVCGTGVDFGATETTFLVLALGENQGVLHGYVRALSLRTTSSVRRTLCSFLAVTS